MMKNWQTTILGTVGAVAIAWHDLRQAFDGDSATQYSWQTILAAALIALAFWRTRDAKEDK